MTTPGQRADRDRRVLRSERVIGPRGLQPLDIAIEGGRISEIAPHGSVSDDVQDLGDLVVMPAAIDAHVHINEPGRTEWEGLQSATRAAAAGGIQLVVDMPLNSSPVTTTPQALRAKQHAVLQRRRTGQLHCDVALFAGVVPENAHDPETLSRLAGAGVAGFKAFLCDSGLAEFPAASEADLLAAMPVLARCGSKLLAHAELLPEAQGRPEARSTEQDGEDPSEQLPADSSATSFAAFVASRPATFETAAIELLVHLCRSTRCPVHIVHVSSAEALPILERAKQEGLPLTAETCPHYLTFCAEQIPDSRTVFKCTPPIRSANDREALWQGLERGTLDFVASDHSPCPTRDKHLESGDLNRAWGGISSLQLLLPVLWSGLRKRTETDLALERVAHWLCKAPAEFLGCAPRGQMTIGSPANLVAWDPEARFTVDAALLQHRHPLTPYDGMVLSGAVHSCFLRGIPVSRNGELLEPTGADLETFGRHPL